MPPAEKPAKTSGLGSETFGSLRLQASECEIRISMGTRGLDLPEALYRYRSGANLGRLLQEISGSHWFCTSDLLNDPFDGVGTIPPENIDEELDVLADYGESQREVQVRRSGREHWMVACFSTEWNSVSMWAHYAGMGTGFCIEYDPLVLVSRLMEPHVGFSLLQREPRFGSVHYVSELPDDTAPVDERLFAKAAAWKYEREWRAALLGLETAAQPGGTTVLLGGAVRNVLLGWNTGSEVTDPVLEAVNKRRMKGEDVSAGIIRLDKATRALRRDWPWNSSLVPRAERE